MSLIPPREIHNDHKAMRKWYYSHATTASLQKHIWYSTQALTEYLQRPLNPPRKNGKPRKQLRKGHRFPNGHLKLLEQIECASTVIAERKGDWKPTKLTYYWSNSLASPQTEFAIWNHRDNEKN